MNDAVQGLIAEHVLPDSYAQIVKTVHWPIALHLAALRAKAGQPIVVGVCGSQASGKSTLSAFLKRLLEQAGLKAEVLSIDDLYLSKEARQALAEAVHPLFITRGPPGTHDVPLGHQVLDVLTGRSPPGVRMPRFDKAADTLAPRETWPPLTGAVDVVLFEGWCVGAKPQDAALLAEPINDLERTRDPDGLWRRYVNDRLSGDYADLYARIDCLLMLKVPDFDAVFEWRALQEKKLGDRLRAEGGLTEGRKLMSPDDLRLFLAHYQRLTQHILAEMPRRADILVKLQRDHAIEGLWFDGQPQPLTP
jgi:D-glycerate 3-kinase